MIVVPSTAAFTVAALSMVVQTLRIENYESISCVALLLYDYGRRTDCHVTLSPPKAERSEAVKL